MNKRLLFFKEKFSKALLIPIVCIFFCCLTEQARAQFTDVYSLPFVLLIKKHTKEITKTIFKNTIGINALKKMNDGKLETLEKVNSNPLYSIFNNGFNNPNSKIKKYARVKKNLLINDGDAMTFVKSNYPFVKRMLPLTSSGREVKAIRKKIRIHSKRIEHYDRNSAYISKGMRLKLTLGSFYSIYNQSMEPVKQKMNE